MSRSKPSACFEMQCPLAVNCTCGHHLDLHPEEGHCSHVDSPKEEGGVGKLCECPSFRSKGAGFVLGVGDPQTAKVAIILEAPGKEELGFQIEGVGAPGIIHPKEAEFRKRDYPEIAEKEPRFLNWGAPIVGKSGSLVNSWLLPKAGLRRTEIFVDNSIRCLVDKNKKGEMYPTGVERHQAEEKCFSLHTSVLTKDRGWQPINKVVVGEEVMSSDLRGNIGYGKVSKLIALDGEVDDIWYGVEIDGAHNKGVQKYSSYAVKCTNDHLWYGPDLEKRADELFPGDKVFIPRLGNQELIFGTMLGDGYINPKNRRLSFSQANEGWCRAKAENFGGEPRRKFATLNGKKYEQWEYVVTVPLEWRKLFYKGKQRLWHPPISIASLAVWYCDDGWIIHNRQGNKTLSIAIHRYTKKDKKRICNWLEEKFGGASLQQKGNVVHIALPFADGFFREVAPFIPPSMYYKLPESFQGRYNGWLSKKTWQVGWVKSSKPTELAAAEKRNIKQKFCISVMGYHRFFTRGGLVANCRRYDRIQQMRPDAVLVSIHPASILREVTPLPLVIKDVEKAASFSRQGLKTLLLMGGKAADVFLGYGTNVTRWRGHYEIVRDKVGGWYESVLERVKGKLKKGKGKAAKKKGKGAVIDAAVDGESMVQEVPVKKVRKSRKKKENSDLQTTLSTS